MYNVFISCKGGAGQFGVLFREGICDAWMDDANAINSSFMSTDICHVAF